MTSGWGLAHHRFLDISSVTWTQLRNDRRGTRDTHRSLESGMWWRDSENESGLISSLFSTDAISTTVPVHVPSTCLSSFRLLPVSYKLGENFDNLDAAAARLPLHCTARIICNIYLASDISSNRVNMNRNRVHRELAMWPLHNAFSPYTHFSYFLQYSTPFFQPQYMWQVSSIPMDQLTCALWLGELYWLESVYYLPYYSCCNSPRNSLRGLL